MARARECQVQMESYQRRTHWRAGGSQQAGQDGEVAAELRGDIPGLGARPGRGQHAGQRRTLWRIASPWYPVTNLTQIVTLTFHDCLKRRKLK